MDTDKQKWISFFMQLIPYKETQFIHSMLIDWVLLGHTMQIYWVLLHYNAIKTIYSHVNVNWAQINRHPSLVSPELYRISTKWTLSGCFFGGGGGINYTMVKKYKK